MEDETREQLPRRRPGTRTLHGGAGSRAIRPISLTGTSGVTLSEASSSGTVGAAAPQEGFPIEMALAEVQGPWKRDRITLSLEAQVIMMEMKSATREMLDFAGQIYSNVVSQLKIAIGRIVILEPFGGYRLKWQKAQLN